MPLLYFDHITRDLAKQASEHPGQQPVTQRSVCQESYIHSLKFQQEAILGNSFPNDGLCSRCWLNIVVKQTGTLLEFNLGINGSSSSTTNHMTRMSPRLRFAECHQRVSGSPSRPVSVDTAPHFCASGIIMLRDNVALLLCALEALTQRQISLTASPSQTFLYTQLLLLLLICYSFLPKLSHLWKGHQVRPLCRSILLQQHQSSQVSLFQLFRDWLDYFSEVQSFPGPTHTGLNLSYCSCRRHSSPSPSGGGWLGNNGRLLSE